MAALEHNSNAASQETYSLSRSEVDADARRDPRRTSEIIGDDRTGEATRVVTIVIAHDHAVVRGVVRRVLEAQEGVEVVGKAGDVATALRKVREQKPNIVVFDLGMPGGGAFRAILTFLEAAPSAAIVVLTGRDEPEYARAALLTGALAFVLKDSAHTELEQAVQAALPGDQYMTPQLASRLETAEATRQLPDHLSGREVDVLQLLALGYTNREIASELFLSIRTVETHRSHIQHKTGRTSRAQLVSYTRENGLFNRP